MTRTVSRSPVTLPLSITPEQAAAIAVALAAQPDGPYATEGRGALDKVLAALEPDPRRREALVTSTLLVRVEAGRADAVRSVLEQALTGHRVVVVSYRDAKGEASRREVEPQLLARTAEREYLVAWCREREAIRWFRQDRIESAELTAESAPRRDPATFGAPPADGHPTHPAGRALGGRAPDPRPRLTLLPGGRQD
ncbi:WYL domain-containing protein [Blastococcus sp. CT_GayMR16]|uniref:helix-turn-helix transcriptional regulator n=1 Tax=Blastococcus sp. CT_GayMR16 TaxID=2559607 RepID=UPI001073461C|nr:WYL domain-containing protein [Blastococcus sp. CT_GayMR16]TFV91260.1 WYL domain-containing protein [Blastococcus sp. CT_GayMR16]